MRGVRDGDVAKLGSLFERHHTALFDFFCRTLGDRAAAQDLCSGMRVYSPNRFSRFRVGSGGPELTFDAFNGDIRVVGPVVGSR